MLNPLDAIRLIFFSFSTTRIVKCHRRVARSIKKAVFYSAFNVPEHDQALHGRFIVCDAPHLTMSLADS